jgi:hypothetical protein
VSRAESDRSIAAQRPQSPDALVARTGVVQRSFGGAGSACT